MCGIAGIHLKQVGAVSQGQLERFVDAALLGIEPRGQDATGFVAVTDDNKVVCDKQAIPAHRFMDDRAPLPESVRTILMHTRFATQGEPSNGANNHPVLYRTCFATHNGHISNDTALFTHFNLQRNAEVDSEAIPAMISHFGFGNLDALEQLEGGFAIAAIDPVVAPGKLLVAKGQSSPFVYFENDKVFVWASTKDALKLAWKASLGTPPKDKKLNYLSPGDAMILEGADKEVFDFKVKERPVRTFTSSGWTSSFSSGTSYRDTYREYCTCGCTQFWHGGPKYDRQCLTKDCECTKFELLSTASCSVSEGRLVRCDSCYDDYDVAVMKYMPSGHVICSGCLAWDNSDASQKPAEQKALPAGDNPLSKYDRLHLAVMARLVELTGYPEELISFVLWEMKPEWANASEELASLMFELDEQYANVEDELRDYVEELEEAERNGQIEDAEIVVMGAV